MTKTMRTVTGAAQEERLFGGLGAWYNERIEKPAEVYR